LIKPLKTELMLELKRPEVAAKYEATTEQDITVHAKGYSGKLSNVNLSGAAHIVSSKHPALKEKLPAANKTIDAGKADKDKDGENKPKPSLN
jgi:hypothetical protein